MELIKKYFPHLKPGQLSKLERLQPLYRQWNQQINVISRKDMEHFYERHVLHSMGIAKVAPFEYGSRVLDVGTGGGFPGIPLAIIFPGSHFTLVDSIGKKIKVVNEVKEAIGLDNVTALQGRAENVQGKFDHIVSRAVTQMPKFMGWVKGKIEKSPKGALLPNGVWYLKGGDLSEELNVLKTYRIFELSTFFAEEFFETKKVLFVKG